VDKEPDLAKTCNELWANSPLADFKSPVLDGIDADLGQIRLLIRDVGPLLSPDIRSFVQHLLRKTSYRQIRFSRSSGLRGRNLWRNPEMD
jgi:hypothetical protein